jgi:cytochrome c biogenesis protein CcmG, thiol:disulfide interchange protein DsbE
MRPSPLLLIVLTLTAAATLVSCDGSDRAYVEPGRLANNATAAPLLPTTVGALPSFDFEMFERLLYQLRGTPVIVNIWASWCEPCRAEAPELMVAAERYGNRVQFIGVDVQDTRSEAATFLSDNEVPYPSVFDVSGEIHDELGFVGLPDTVFYASGGEISATWTGPLTTEALGDNISVLLDGKSLE